MKILLIGDASRHEECRDKFGDEHEYHRIDRPGSTDHSAVVFDFEFHCRTDAIRAYDHFDGVVFVETSAMSVGVATEGSRTQASFFGFAGLPTFLNREALEVSMLPNADHSLLKTTCGSLGTAYRVVKDQVGLVTPRVVCMIINEAYFALEENIATRHDIDQAMKLGTNYPFGPFEWCEKIGIDSVHRVLTSVYQATGNDRYRVCPLLQKEASISKAHKS